MKDSVYFSCDVGEDNITIYGAGKFAEEKLILNKTQCSLLFIELLKFLKVNDPILFKTSENNPLTDIEFIKWYSGMEEHKILNAYKRYIKEKK